MIDKMDLADSIIADGAGNRVGSTPEFWRMIGKLDPRQVAIARSNLESQIGRVEQSGLRPQLQKDLTDDLYTHLERLEQFEKEGAARTPQLQVLPGAEAPSEAAAAPVPPGLEATGPPEEPAAKPSPLGSSGITHVEAGFDSHEEFRDAWQKQAEHQYFETPEEFARRLYCSGAAA